MEVILKLNIFCLLFDKKVQHSWPVMSAHELPKALVCAHEYPGALMSMVLWCHECSWVLMSAHSLVAPCSQLLLCSDECSLLHGTKLMSAHGCSWVFNGNQEHSWLLLAAHECSKVLMDAHECSWLLISSTHEKPWAWCYGTMSTHESSRAVMSMAPWGYEHSSALLSADGTLAPYSWVLLGTHEHTWALMGAHECSWQDMSAELLHQTINKKC